MLRPGLLVDVVYRDPRGRGGLPEPGYGVRPTRWTRAGTWHRTLTWHDALIVDLSADDFDGAVLVDSMALGHELAGVATIGFYPHVDQELRRRALAAGYDVVVPRSRMAREADAVLGSALER